MKHSPQGLPNQTQLRALLEQMQKDFEVFKGIRNVARAIRDSADSWKQMARDIRQRAENENAAPLDNRRVQALVKAVVINDVTVRAPK